MLLYSNPNQYHWYRYSGPLYFRPILLIVVLYGLIREANFVIKFIERVIHNIHVDCHISVNPTLNRLQSIPLFGQAGYVLLQENNTHCEVCGPKPEPYTACLEIDLYFLLFIQIVIWYTDQCKLLSKFNSGKHLVKCIWNRRSKSITVHVPYSVSFLFHRIRNVT